MSPSSHEESVWDEGGIAAVGSVGPYHAYDIEDWEPPSKSKKRLPFGFCIERSPDYKKPKKKKRKR